MAFPHSLPTCPGDEADPGRTPCFSLSMMLHNTPFLETPIPKCQLSIALKHILDGLPSGYTNQNPRRISCNGPHSHLTLIRSREATETKQQSIHPTNTRLDITSQNYNSPKLKYLCSSVEKQTLTARIMSPLHPGSPNAKERSHCSTKHKEKPLK